MTQTNSKVQDLGKHLQNQDQKQALKTVNDLQTHHEEHSDKFKHWLEDIKHDLEHNDLTRAFDKYRAKMSQNPVDDIAKDIQKHDEKHDKKEADKK